MKLSTLNNIPRYILPACFLFSVQLNFQDIEAQKVRSGKSSIHINSMRADDAIITDTIPPLVKIISPEFDRTDMIKSNEPEITIIAKITDSGSGVNKAFINAKECPVTDDGIIVQKINLIRGENKINILTMDKDDNYYQKDLLVEYIIEQEKNMAQLTVAGDYYALIIGIDEYEDPNLMDLDNPVRDADALYKVLTADYSFDTENVILLKNAKRADITNSLDIMAEKLTKEDNLLIFYAGHGWWDEQANVGYWLPNDARLSRKAEWFRNSALCDYLKEINSKHTLLVADACFGGAIFKTRSVSMDAPKAIQMLYDLPSRKAMTSGTLTEVPDRSSFVKYLIERLSSNDDKYVSSEQLFSSFRIAVINNSDVIPQYGEIRNVGDQGGDFIFIKRD